MKHSGLIAFGAVAALALAASPAAAVTNLLANSSFESHSAFVTAGKFTTGKGDVLLGSTVAAGSTAITDWTVTQGNVGYVENYIAGTAGQNSWQPAGGSYSIELFTNDSITNSVTTVVGQVYKLTYYYSGNPSINGATILRPNSSLADYVNGQVYVPGNSQAIQYNTALNSRSSMDWVQATYYFTATSTSSTISFSGQGIPNAAPPGSIDQIISGEVAIDNVSVTAAPEPATWALMLLGFGGMGGMLRLSRRAKQAVVLA